jgi:hypothetical protein
MRKYFIKINCLFQYVKQLTAVKNTIFALERIYPNLLMSERVSKPLLGICASQNESSSRYEFNHIGKFNNTCFS